jgi:putative transposase
VRFFKASCVSGRSVKERQAMIKQGDFKLSVREQCWLVGISRSGYYREPVGVSELNLKLMELIEEKYTAMPYYGSLKLHRHLLDLGYKVNIKRVQRLMTLMDIQALYPKPRTSQPGDGHKIYPYLLKDLSIDRPNQVWCTDITFIRIKGGFMYLIAVMDWHSRYVLSWELSNSLDRWFCLDALNAALAMGTPAIFNTDQGCQFTSQDFTQILQSKDIQISMDGKGRWMDNVMIERLWRSLKYEDIYLKHYQSVDELYDGLVRYFYTYNHQRLHQSLDYKTPAQVYFNSVQKEVIVC